MQILWVSKGSAQDKKIAVGVLMYIVCDSTMPIIVLGGPYSAINYQDTTITKR